MRDAVEATSPAPVEEAVSSALARGDVRSAAEALAEAYGAEVYGWLAAVLGPVEAADVHGAVMLRVVSALATFRGESSARTWLYAVARNEARQWMRSARRRRRLLTPLEDHPSAADRAASVRTDPGAADRIAALRARLSADDRSLLVLRIDRGFAYPEIARIGMPTAPDEAIAREAARLRQRVHEIKRRLRRWSEAPS